MRNKLQDNVVCEKTLVDAIQCHGPVCSHAADWQQKRGHRNARDADTLLEAEQRPLPALAGRVIAVSDFGFSRRDDEAAAAERVIFWAPNSYHPGNRSELRCVQNFSAGRQREPEKRTCPPQICVLTRFEGSKSLRYVGVCVSHFETDHGMFRTQSSAGGGEAWVYGGSPAGGVPLAGSCRLACHCACQCFSHRIYVALPTVVWIMCDASSPGHLQRAGTTKICGPTYMSAASWGAAAVPASVCAELVFDDTHQGADSRAR